MPLIPFAEWKPDLPALSQWAREMLNVIPLEESYGPLGDLSTTGGAVNAQVQGAAWFRAPNNIAYMFAGTATGLFRWTGSSWAAATRVSGAYGLGPDNQWRFAQFGTLAIAVNGVDVPQKFNLAAGGKWTALAGSPPTGAHYTATVRDFLMMGRVDSTPQRIQWSGQNNCETWGSDATTQADYQDLPDGGNVNGLVGTEIGLVLQENAVRRLTYEGPPTVFRIDKIANDIGCSVPGSVASVGDLAFFVHKSGFYMVQGGQTLTPIGRGKVDRTFWAEFDNSYHFYSSAAIDPVRGLYVFAYPTTSSATHLPDKLLIYNWRTDRWSHATIDTEYVFYGATQSGYTLEQLDAFGTVDTLAYSLDSEIWSGPVTLTLYAFNQSHRLASFSGSNLAATMETAEFQPAPGRRAVVRGCRPLIDGGTPTVSLGARETQQASVTYGSDIAVTAAGDAPIFGSGRYFRLKAKVPAASTWSNGQGVDLDDDHWRAAGKR